MGDIARAIGLTPTGLFLRERCFLLALIAGVAFWCFLALSMPLRPVSWPQLLSWSFWSLAVWHPLAEELIFRGFLQGQLLDCTWGRRSIAGLSCANGLTTAIFVLGHFWQHPPLWALSVAVPSLVFGYVRDRYGSVYPAIVLHMVYNAGYFSLTGLP
ncbi:JDVT-CTERM system glutamic-type intramembrane protease MrtJ [Candidatus Entotheonella palauensis]|uniref:JDVT-CTERM system glutamic-type intramembrane protease MrtJ n=1 Tax=Candidatus Entotheonella palauensis TaxID=93172 RepID=UPI000B7EC090|nr:JDVT-CTERM system glutamic-type intramembrane protease [Candidatus Entotheonella palauensis]